jgi:hypothetical protein
LCSPVLSETELETRILEDRCKKNLVSTWTE